MQAAVSLATILFWWFTRLFKSRQKYIVAAHC
jgi:hypothetical protein